jgi:hypothetical protein
VNFPEFGPTDHIEFQLLGSDVAIIVNGRSLVRMLHDIELPLAKWEGSPDLAGSYCGLTTADVLPISRHFLGKPRRESTHQSGKVPILACKGCGDWECWPMLVRISVAEKTILWTDFEQPRRTKWKYRDLALRFDRVDYESSLMAAARDLSQG